MPAASAYPMNDVYRWDPAEGVIGVLGVAPAATADFFRRITALIPARKDWEHVRVIIDSNPKLPSRGRHLELGETDPSPYLREGIRGLAHPVTRARAHRRRAHRPHPGRTARRPARSRRPELQGSGARAGPLAVDRRPPAAADPRQAGSALDGAVGAVVEWAVRLQFGASAVTTPRLRHGDRPGRPIGDVLIRLPYGLRDSRLGAARRAHAPPDAIAPEPAGT